MKFELIAFDADDTLWHNEILYSRAKEKLSELLSEYGTPEQVFQVLDKIEMRNLEPYGYGIKAFTLSMIETAVQISDGHIIGEKIQKIIEAAKDMIDTSPLLFEHVHEAVSQLAEAHQIMLITKGDLLDQEKKLSRSGLARYFHYVEILSDKRRQDYALILEGHKIDPGQFMMVGNSLRSDILPVVELGGCAVYIPHDLTWSHESEVELPVTNKDYVELKHIGELPDLVKELEERQGTTA